MTETVATSSSRAGPWRRLMRRWRGEGLRWMVRAALDRVAPARVEFRAAVFTCATGARVLEIGGPSRVFGSRGILPIYPRAARVDNVNFAVQTAWEKEVQEGAGFHFHPGRAPGTQWIREAAALAGIPDGQYDLVVSSHCLEHVANPLAALNEWRRVARPRGHLILVLPDPVNTFDHRRPITTLAHLHDDFLRGVSEDDATHIPEVLALHDLSRDAGVGSAEEFRERCQHNFANRCLHHHVFDRELMIAALRAAAWEPLAAARARPLHLVAFARKASQ